MVTAMKKTMRASMAFEVTWEPQVAPTSLKSTLFGEVCAALARASCTFVSMSCRWAGVFEFRSTVTWIWRWWLSWLVSWTTVGWLTPADSAAAVASATVRVWELTSQDWPPLKSMPALRPRVDSEMIPSRMMMAEMPNHQRRLPMKSNEVSPPVQADEDVGGLMPAASSSASSAAYSSSSSKASSSWPRRPRLRRNRR